ncbi:hypothetical protein K8I28_00135 [bacterium]|nr:hypothetical protein [bacterium]
MAANISNKNLTKVLELTREMLDLAEDGDRNRTDSTCGILFGFLRDSAYKLRRMTDHEIELHRKRGEWEDESE